MATHDPSYKLLFSHRDLVADLIRGFVHEDLAAAGEIPAGSPLPPVLPIVLYNGEQPWWAKTSLEELIAPNLPEPLLRWQPQMRYLLLDEQRLGETALVGQRNVAAALFRLENSRDPARTPWIPAMARR
jgi:hypothetical protein